MSTLIEQLAEMERLIQAPTSENISRACTLALNIARSEESGTASHLAMQLLSALQNLRRNGSSEDGGPAKALWRLREALENSAAREFRL